MSDDKNWFWLIIAKYVICAQFAVIVMLIAYIHDGVDRGNLVWHTCIAVFATLVSVHQLSEIHERGQERRRSKRRDAQARR